MAAPESRREQTVESWAERSREVPVVERPRAVVRPEHRARERLVLVGLVLLGVGAGAVYWPAGLILPGVYLLVVTWPRAPRPRRD